MYKDEMLMEKVKAGCNIAKFVGIGPDKSGAPSVRMLALSRDEIVDDAIGQNYNWEAEVEKLYNLCNGLLSVRTYLPEKHSGNPFKPELTDLQEIKNYVCQFIAEGYHVLVNEGSPFANYEVSGVMHGDRMEMSPNDSPRCVEKEGNCVVPTKMGIHILNTIFNSSSVTDTLERFENTKTRVEFSIYPYKCGVFDNNCIIWETEDFSKRPDLVPGQPSVISWPNNLSKVVGDKAFGLIICDYIISNFGVLCDVAIPYTLVVNENFGVFPIGDPLGSSDDNDWWYRTCPAVRKPGKLPTKYGQANIFELHSAETPSVIQQMDVGAEYSGSFIKATNGICVVEGVKGHGDKFMVGEQTGSDVPKHVMVTVEKIANLLEDFLGDTVEIEWASDGDQMLHILQLSVGNTIKSLDVIVPGKFNKDTAVYFDADTQTLQDLEQIIANYNSDGGILIKGRFGLTSHLAHLLIDSGIPSKFV
jgi:hypothetical protein